MKNLFLVSFAFLICLGVNAQKSKDDKYPAQVPPVVLKQTDNTLLSSYQRAMDYADLEAAKNVVYQLIATDAGTGWLDSLVQLYFSMGAYSQCVLSANDYLSKVPNDKTIMELLAASDYSLKRYKESLEDYEKLFKTSQSSYHAYQIAINQYMLKRYGECETTVQFILADKANEKQTLQINLTNGGSQTVPMKAAAWNLRGVAFKDVNKTAEAQKCFEESLKIFPDFVLAKGNLDAGKPAEKGAVNPAPAQKTAPKKK